MTRIYTPTKITLEKGELEILSGKVKDSFNGAAFHSESQAIGQLMEWLQEELKTGYWDDVDFEEPVSNYDNQLYLEWEFESAGWKFKCRRNDDFLIDYVEGWHKEYGVIVLLVETRELL